MKIIYQNKREFDVLLRVDASLSITSSIDFIVPAGQDKLLNLPMNRDKALTITDDGKVVYISTREIL